MADSDKPGENRPQRAGLKRGLAVLLPLLFLGLAYVVLYSPRGLFKFRRGGAKPVLTQLESQRLSDLSKSLLGQNKYQEALDPTLTLYRAYPENHIYIGRLAEIYDHLGRYDEEAAYWEKYMDHAPTPVEACPQIGQAYWKQGEKFEQQAVTAYERCVALDPKNTDSIFYLAHALEMSDQWPRAVEQYQKGLAISPTYTDLTLGLARCWLRMDKPDDAKRLADQVLAKRPDSSGALLVLGMYYLHQDNYSEAKKALTRGVQLADEDPDFHVLLARVAEQTNDNAEALRQYTRVLELRPGDAGAQSRKDALATQNASK
ncbi:MAG: tetratricopeptide repeat protein [Acidobacteriia bacterium]|nr:tetratricopeptide repeat protein [Terriglobia bacterium]